MRQEMVGFWDGSGISCTSLQTDNHTNTSSLNFLKDTNSGKALKAYDFFK